MDLSPWDDEPTLVRARPEPPALPFPLGRARSGPGDLGWLDELPPEARAVLEQARRCAESWPRARRIPGAVATPSRLIPSLGTPRHV